MAQFNPETTTTTEELHRRWEVSRVVQLVATKNDIIAALRAHVARLEGELAMYRREFGNGEEDANA